METNVWELQVAPDGPHVVPEAATLGLQTVGSLVVVALLLTPPVDEPPAAVAPPDSPPTEATVPPDSTVPPVASAPPPTAKLPPVVVPETVGIGVPLHDTRNKTRTPPVET